MTKMNVGQKIALSGKISAFDTRLNKVCIDGLKVDGDSKKDHVWVNYTDRLKLVELQVGDMLSFTAIVRSYLGLDTEHKQTIKIGICKLRNIKKG